MAPKVETTAIGCACLAAAGVAFQAADSSFVPAATPRNIAVQSSGRLRAGLSAGPAAPQLLTVGVSGVAALCVGAAAAQRRGARAVRSLAAAGAEAPLGRRDGLLLGFAGGIAVVVAKPKPAVADGNVTPGVLAKATDELQKLIQSDPNKGPTLVRLAWHSSGTYDKMSKTGGSQQGTIRFKEELAHGGNAGLDKAVAWLEPIKQSVPDMSYADLYTLSGVVAVKTLGGPAVPWRAGRVDSMDPKDVTPDGRLPGADNGSYAKDATHIREIFNRMGFNDQEIVALSGAHALGRCHADASGFVGPWTPTPTMFNNLYFTLLKNAKWEEGCVEGETCKNHQYVDVDSKKLMMLPTDIALIKDASFNKYVNIYADDKEVFFKDFSKAFSTLLELGTKGLYVVA